MVDEERLRGWGERVFPEAHVHVGGARKSKTPVEELWEQRRRRKKQVEEGFNEVVKASKKASESTDSRPKRKLTLMPAGDPESADSRPKSTEDQAVAISHYPIAEHENEYRVIRAEGKTFELTPDQAEIVMLLWRSYKNEEFRWYAIRGGFGKHLQLSQAFKTRKGSLGFLFISTKKRGVYRLRLQFRD